MIRIAFGILIGLSLNAFAQVRIDMGKMDMGTVLNVAAAIDPSGRVVTIKADQEGRVICSPREKAE